MTKLEKDYALVVAENLRRLIYEKQVEQKRYCKSDWSFTCKCFFMVERRTFWRGIIKEIRFDKDRNFFIDWR